MKCQVLIRSQSRHIRPVLLFLRLRLPMPAHQDSNFTQPLLRRYNLRLCKTPIIGLEVVDFKLTFPHSRILFPIPRNFLSLYFFHRQVWFLVSVHRILNFSFCISFHTNAHAYTAIMLPPTLHYPKSPFFLLRSSRTILHTHRKPPLKPIWLLYSFYPVSTNHPIICIVSTNKLQLLTIK